MTLDDLLEFDIPQKHKERMDNIRECFERQDYDGIKAIADISEGML